MVSFRPGGRTAREQLTIAPANTPRSFLGGCERSDRVSDHGEGVRGLWGQATVCPPGPSQCGRKAREPTCRTAPSAAGQLLCGLGVPEPGSGYVAELPLLIPMSGEQHLSVLVAFGSDLLELQNLFFFPFPSSFSFGSGCF